MFDQSRFKNALNRYKEDFITRWETEKYKWEAVKCFQDNWNIDATNFADMLKSSIPKEIKSGLFNFVYTSSFSYIEHFAENEPEAVREMFIALFDRSEGLYERIDNFQKTSEELLKKYPKGKTNEYIPLGANEISAYLWLRYPDDCYVYNTARIKDVSHILQSDYTFADKDYANNFRNCYEFCDEICAALKKDNDLIDILKKYITDTCYSDPGLITLTIDFGYYISQQRRKGVDVGADPNTVVDLKNKSDELDSYIKSDFLNEVYISGDKYNTLVAVLKNKKNIILQGAPGVGKTFAAKRLAYSMMGEKDESRIEFVQFHQNYSYEDFVMGYKPTENNFELKYGVFYKFCQKAAADSQRDYFFIIDEINRGNMSKIFGELLMLIECDYHDTTITLAYNDEKFSVPSNLYIIGMMNTADRSLAMIDYALRRRFSFFDMEPAFNSEGFRKYQNELNNDTLNELIDKVKDLNKEISADRSLGKGFCIGHSYFCGCTTCDETWIKSIVEYDILPMLSEYWFDDINKLEYWQNNLRGVFNDQR